MRKFKALNLLNDKGFWPEKTALVDAIREVLTLGRCTKRLPIRDYSRYRDPRHWRNDEGELVPYHSVDWYVADALDEDRMQVDAGHILRAFGGEPWRRDDMMGDHYDLFVMDEDMFDSDLLLQDGVEYAVGRAERSQVAVISTHRIEHIWGMPYSYLKTEVMRQLCFMFGVPDIARDDVEISAGRAYCTNTCILREALVAPDDWELLTQERICVGALCPRCAADLQVFFEEMALEPA